MSVSGNRMFLDPNDSLHIRVFGSFEPCSTEFAKQFIREGDVVLDVGAHIGYYTLIFAKLVGEHGRVYAFEPEPGNLALLEANVRINGYRNVVIVPKAVSDGAGRVRLYLSKENAGDHRTYDSLDERKSIEVDAVVLDDYFIGSDGRVDLIKIDIEGAEAAAVHGMRSILEKNEDLSIISEFWPLGLKRFGVEPEEYLRLLLGYGFRLYDIDEKRNKIQPASVRELCERYTPGKGNFTNLACVRQKGAQAHSSRSD